MKIKTLVAVLLLSGGVTSTFAQSDCNANSSISHEAVRAKNFKDAYAPCMAVLKDCPTLRYYTYTDAQKILTGLMSQIKDRNSAEYKKMFDELMAVHDQKMKYIPEFASKMRGVPSVASALGTKAVDYLQYAPAPDLNQEQVHIADNPQLLCLMQTQHSVHPSSLKQIQEYTSFSDHAQPSVHQTFFYTLLNYDP